MHEHQQIEDALLWYSPVVLIEVDLGGVIRAHNSLLPFWLNETEERESNVLVGRNFVDWLTQSARLHYETYFIPKLLQQGMIREVIIQVKTSESTITSVMLNGNLITDPATGERRIFLAIMDASERIRFEKGLIEAQRRAEIAQERLSILQDATSRLAVAEGIDDLGLVLSDTASRATQAAWSCAAILSTADTVEHSSRCDRTRVWGTTPELPFAILDLVRGNTTQVYRSPAELKEAFPVHAAAFDARGVEACIVSPIVRTESDTQSAELLGAIFTWFRRERTLDSEITETLQALAVQAERVLEHLNLQEHTRYRSLHDSLTGLSNRLLLLERLEHTIAVSARTGAPCAVFFLDLDGFKTINDHLGHGIGDDVLREVANRLRETCRPTETISRLGGDEFVIAGEHIDWNTATEISNRVLAAIRQPLDGIAPGFPISASIGTIVWDPRLESTLPTSAELLEGADAVMYEAKHGGKNGVQIRHWFASK